MKKTFFTLTLGLFTVISAFAATSYTLTGTGSNLTLTITGTGDMPDYINGSAPWYSERDNIKTLVIEEGVTGIGDFAFYECSELTGTLTIPNLVTSIGNYAFCECSGLIGTLTIPNSVTSIGNNAFCVCSGLTEVTIPNSVTSIGSEAFYGCSGLTGTLTIPNSVTSIGFYALNSCTGITAINVDANNTNYSSNNGMLYNKLQDTLICCPAGKQGSVTIPNSVASIGNYAFYGCSGLTEVTIPNSVTSIGFCALNSCTGITAINVDANNTNYSSNNGMLYNKLQYTLICCPAGKQGSVTIPNSVTSIGDRAFYGCSGLTEVTIPNSVTSIGDYAFRNCSGLTTVNFNATNCYKMGDYYSPVFPGCTNLTTLNIGSNVTRIPDYAFYNCSRLTGTLNILNSVTSIGDRAFAYCSGLTGTLTIPNSVTTIGSGAFSSCSGLTGLTIGSGVTEIGIQAFLGCTGLTDIYVSWTTPPSINANVFFRITVKNIKLHIPKGRLSIYQSAPVWQDFNIMADQNINSLIVKFNHANLSLKPEETATLEMLVNGFAVTATNWKSSNPAAATVSETGLITAVALGGTTEITAETEVGGLIYTAKCVVYVEPQTIVIEETDPVTNGTGSIVITLEIPASTLFTGSFEIILPAGVSISIDATQLAGAWSGSINLAIVPLPNNTWKFIFTLSEAAQQSKMRKIAANTNKIVDIVYNVDNSVTNDFELKIKDLSFTLQDENNTVIERKETVVPVTVNSITDNSVIETSHSIKIFPNPVKDELIIENGELKIENVEILDMYGRKIVNYQLSIFNSINVSDLPAGVYILKIGEYRGRFVKE